MVNSKPGLVKNILFAWLLAGTLDILAAFAWFILAGGKDPSRVLVFIASGYFGKAAFAGGEEMIIAGLIFHYLVAFCFTVLFFFLYPSSVWFRKNILVTAILFGGFTWLVMNLLVIPFSKISSASFHLASVCIGISILIFLFAFPMLIIIRKYYRRAIS